MKKYVKNAVKSALSKPLRGKYRRLLSIGVSALLAVSAFLTVIPQTQTNVYAAGTDKKLQLGASALADNAGASGAATVYYGKNDQTWRVIGYGTTGVASTSGKLALLAGSAMSSSKFNNYNAGEDCNNYAGSLLKNAVDAIYSSTYFTEKEMEAIIKRDLNVQEYSATAPYTDGISGTALTGDNAPYLWPLSTKEAYTLYDNGNGLGITNIGDDWWLRSPGNIDGLAALVLRDGNVADIGFYVNNIEGVRPAFNLNLSSIILTSAAEGGKNPGTGGAGTLNEVAAYGGTAWKLTISDSTRSSFTASAGTGATVSMPEGYTSWTVPVTYSGAKTGTNEHVSAILTNSAGTALYYGYIATNSASSTEGVDVNIPTDLSVGTYKLKVFNEQVNGTNGNYATDLSSDFHDITLTVTEAQEQVATPTFTPAAGTYSTAQNVTISCTTAGATIHYTTDGTAPTATSSTYSSPINVSGTTTIKAIAVKDGMTNSSVASARYTISATPVDTCTITFEPNGGRGSMEPQTVDRGVRTRLNRNSFTRRGYSFDGWNTRADGKGTGYEDRDHVTVNDNITLYAQWEKEKHKDDDDDHDDEPAPSNNNNTKVPDGCDELRQSLSSAIATAAVSGKPQTVYWSKGTSLPYDVMKMLHDNPNVTLVFSYTYLGQNYTVTIPGSAAIANPAVPWYGPVYLYALYGNTKISALTTNTKAATGNYTVKSGDTLSAIAKRLKTTVKHLKDVNNIKNVDRIKPGMVLKY